MAGCALGFPDVISFLCLFSTGVYGVLVPVLTYVTLGIERYGAENVSLIVACYSVKNESNVTCTSIGDAITEDLSSITVYINTVKAICAPIFMFLLGSYSDTVGQKFAINAILCVNVFWCAIYLVNTFFLTNFPSGMYIFANGFILGVAGGSTFTVNSFLNGYLSLTTPPSKQAARFSLLMGFSLIGYITGPVVSGIIMKVTLKFWILGVLSTCMMTAALLIGVFALKQIQDKPADEITDRNFCEKFTRALKRQYRNIIDLFRYQAYLGKYLSANLMFLLSSVALISPFVVISSVYLLADPFKWSISARSYLTAGMGLLLALQNIVTIPVLKMFRLSRPAIVRVGIFLGFAGTFFLALASTDTVLILGIGLSSFVIISSPTIQSIILSLVEPEQIGTAVGVMAAVQGFAESGIVNVILLVYEKTRDIMNGFCFFTLSFLLGVNLVIAMFYRHPQTTHEDRAQLTTDDPTPGTPVMPSSDVLKGGVPKPSSTLDSGIA